MIFARGRVGRVRGLMIVNRRLPYQSTLWQRCQ
jgi:hypothetical protein